MMIRLDLRRYPDPVGVRQCIRAAFPFGCADCGRWFQFARQLVEHRCEACDD